MLFNHVIDPLNINQKDWQNYHQMNFLKITCFLFNIHFLPNLCVKMMSLVAQLVKNLPTVQETRVPSLGWEDPLEKEIATHSSILGWKISWTEEPGGLQSMGLQRVGHDWATNTYLKQKTTTTKNPLDLKGLLLSSWCERC